MSDDVHEIRRIAWRQIFPWLCLLGCFRQAIRARVLLLALLGVLATTVGWRVIGNVFSGAEQLQNNAIIELYGQWPWQSSPVMTRALFGQIVELGGAHYSRSFDQLLVLGFMFDANTDFTVTVYLLCNLLWVLAVWAFFGGAITRIAALAFARGEQISWTQARDYAFSKWTAYFTAPLMPLVGVFLITMVMALFALLIRIPYVGIMIGGIGWPLWLAGGFLIAILMLGLAACWPLMWATISCEGTDSFDALGRGFGYLFGKPLRYLFYACVSLGLGYLGWIVVDLFANTVVGCTAWAVSWGSSHDVLRNAFGAGPVPLEYADAWGSHLIGFWNGCVMMLPTAYAYSFFWTAAISVYLLLRRDEDQTDMDEVYLDEQNESYSLPPLETDAAGLPEAEGNDPPTTPADDEKSTDATEETEGPPEDEAT